MSKLNANSVEMGSLTTAQRDALSSVATGTVIFNSTTGVGQVYTGTSWVDFGNSAQFIASGGTTLTSGSYTYHVFTSPGTFSVTSGSKSVDYVVVGSGAGGVSADGGNGGGGGGGGGVVYTPGHTVASGSSPITVGTGQPNGLASTQAPSSIAFVSTATGGTSSTGISGSSGGASGGPGPFAGGPGTLNTGCGGVRAGGGGGGAGAVGGPWTDSSPDIGGNGGAGLAVPAFPGPIFSPIMPAPWVSAVGPTGLFGGGGGGGDERGQPAGGAGGPGGGAQGGDFENNGRSAITNTGGGGGGHGGRGCVVGRAGGPGASGIVIIRYLT